MKRRSFFSTLFAGLSFNGRTLLSKSSDSGSNPGGPATIVPICGLCNQPGHVLQSGDLLDRHPSHVDLVPQVPMPTVWCPNAPVNWDTYKMARLTYRGFWIRNNGNSRPTFTAVPLTYSPCPTSMPCLYAQHPVILKRLVDFTIERHAILEVQVWNALFHQAGLIPGPAEYAELLSKPIPYIESVFCA